MKERPEEIFRRQGGQMRMSEALRHGITRYMLYSLRDKGIIEQMSRGVYRLVELPPVSDPDLVTVALRIPKAVICLISALSFHELTTQIPHNVSFAVPRKAHIPSIEHPPTQVYRFAKSAYEAGQGKHQIDNIPVKVYNPEKTLVDCFKFRNRIGMDIILEALKIYRERRDFKADDILHYARICRVERVMRPYLEVTV